MNLKANYQFKNMNIQKGSYRMTWLGAANRYFFQWFFVRLCKGVPDDFNGAVRYDFLKGVIPLTGWNTDYIYIQDIRRKLFHGKF